MEFSPQKENIKGVAIKKTKKRLQRETVQKKNQMTKDYTINKTGLTANRVKFLKVQILVRKVNDTHFHWFTFCLNMGVSKFNIKWTSF